MENGSSVGTQLDELIAAIAANPAIAAKRSIGLVSEAIGPSGFVQGPGDDGAAVLIGGATAIVCGEALWPPFVKADPRGAGMAAILANVNDLAAMGAVPDAIVDTIVASESVAREVLDGMRYAAEIYRVPIVGGHLTITQGEPSVSAFALGHAEKVLSTTNVDAGQDLIVAACIEGVMRDDFPFFSSFSERGFKLGDDVRLFARIAASGLASSAKDISMAGLIGSLAMLLEWGSFGANIDLDVLPTPPGVTLAQWCNCFPCFGFLLTCDPDTTTSCVDVLLGAGLAAAKVGAINTTGIITVSVGSDSRTALDLRSTIVTGLTRSS
jgi:selenophosphate synthetase-related protein